MTGLSRIQEFWHTRMKLAKIARPRRGNLLITLFLVTAGGIQRDQGTLMIAYLREVGDKARCEAEFFYREFQLQQPARILLLQFSTVWWGCQL